MDQEVIKSKMQSNDITYVTTREVPGQAGQVAVFYSCKAINGFLFIVELKFKAGMNICKITVKSSNKVFSELCKSTVSKILVF